MKGKVKCQEKRTQLKKDNCEKEELGKVGENILNEWIVLLFNYLRKLWKSVR